MSLGFSSSCHKEEKHKITAPKTRLNTMNDLHTAGRNRSKGTKIEPTETLSIETLTTKTIDPKFKVPHTTRVPTNSTE
ncbi:hypothetical protein YC2023_103436 [Brassica napus]